MSGNVRVLITGGAGFIGRRLSIALTKNGYKVRILDPLTVQIHGAVPKAMDWLEGDAIEFIRGSVTQRQDIENAIKDVQHVVHLAAETGTGQSMYEVERYYGVNCQGTAMLFDVLANNSQHQVKRIVLASSRSVYGEGAFTCHHCDQAQRITPEPRSPSALAKGQWEPECPACSQPLTAVPTRETDLIRPASMYASSKYAQEDIVRIGCQSLDIGYAILRLQNVYGEGQSLNNPYTGILSIFSTRIRRRLNLPIFEDGKESRDFVHVDDVAGAMMASIAAPEAPNCVLNVGSGAAISVLDIARKLSEVLGAEPNTVITGQYRVGDIRHNTADIQALRHVLGYHPKVSLEEGMQRFARWVLEQPLPEDKLGKALDELKARNLLG
jgi:dTDP-L-rhamnose 4-epimerase